MAIIQSGSAAATPMLVDPAFGAARVAERPMDSLAWHSVGAPTGLITGIAAGGPIFSLRNISANLILVRRVGIGFLTTTAFTTAQAMSFGLQFARNFTASDTAGTAIALTGNNATHRTSLATPTSLDARIATTGALTAGTRTLDANLLSVQAGFSAAAGVSLPPALDNLLSHDTGDYPLVLAQNEGLLIVNLTAMGATGVGNGFVNLEFAEVSPTGF
jgi:hypothetical protein